MPSDPRRWRQPIRFMWNCPWRIEWKSRHEYWWRSQFGPFYILHPRRDKWDKNGDEVADARA